MKPAISIIGREVVSRDDIHGVLVGTDEEPKLRIDWAGPKEPGCVARYLNAGQTYTLTDLDQDDAYFKNYVVPDEEVNDEARRNGGSVIVLQLSIDENTNEFEYLAIEVDS
jgi:hypothetical protein